MHCTYYRSRPSDRDGKCWANPWLHLLYSISIPILMSWAYIYLAQFSCYCDFIMQLRFTRSILTRRTILANADDRKQLLLATRVLWGVKYIIKCTQRLKTSGICMNIRVIQLSKMFENPIAHIFLKIFMMIIEFWQVFSNFGGDWKVTHRCSEYFF